MGYTRFSTDNANYHLDYGIHIKTTNLEGIENLDGLVLEKVNMYWRDPESLKKPSKQYKKIIKEAEDLGIPIYMPDPGTGSEYPFFHFIRTTFLMSPIFFRESFSKFIETGHIDGLPTVLSLGAIAYLTQSVTSGLSSMYLGLKKSEIKKSLAEKFVSKTSDLLVTPVIAGRNIIASEKIEEFITPKLQDELGRKPNVGIVYGAGHCGIKRNLQDESQRKGLLNLYSKFNYFGIEKDTINNVLEFRFDGKDWNLKEYNTNLF